VQGEPPLGDAEKKGYVQVDRCPEGILCKLATLLEETLIHQAEKAQVCVSGMLGFSNTRTLFTKL
jgi:hypothetical protein